MSSHIDRDGDLDPVLRYAPSRARAQGQIPPSSTIPPADQPLSPQSPNASEFCGDRGIVETRHRLTLEPQWVPEPPQDAAPDRNLWMLALRTSGVLGLAALLAWVVVSLPGVIQLGRYVMPAVTPPEILPSANSRMSVPPSGVIVSSSAVSSSVATKAVPEPSNRTVATAERPAPQTKERTDSRAQPVPISSALAAKIQPPADRQTSLAEQAPPAPTLEATRAEQRSAPDLVVTRQLDRDELASMLRRADDFIKSGDLSSARLLLRRAAEAGNAQAALTLAGTYDPSVLAALGLQDGAADLTMARLWYERAEQFGSSEAPRRLRELATNSAE